MTDFVPDLDDIEFDALAGRARALIPRFAQAWTDHNLHDPGMTIIDLFAWIVDQQVYRAGAVGGRHRAAFAALLGQRPQPVVAARGLLWPDGPPPAGMRIGPVTTAVCLTHRELPFEVEQEAELYLPAVTLKSRTENSFVFDGPLGDGRAARISIGFDLAEAPGTPATGDHPWGPVRYLYRAGGSRWHHLCVLHDDTHGLAVTGVVELGIPARPTGPGPSELRLDLGQGFFPVRPRIRAMAVNVLRVRQVGRAGRQRLRADDAGRPDLLIPLDTTGLVEPLVIKINDTAWEQRTDLTLSGPKDDHYLVRLDGIGFGNGVNGRVLPAGAVVERGPTVRTAGSAGNLASGQRWTLPALGDAVYGRNRRPITGGRDAGGDPAAAARAVAVQRAALLTDAELITAATTLPGLPVERAETIAGFDRRLPGRPVAGVRTLVVRGADPAEVAARLEPRRVLGERLIVESPVLVPVDLRLELVVEAGSVGVPENVRNLLRERLSAANATLGRRLTVAGVVAMAVTVPGVVDVPVVRIGAPPGDGPVEPPPDGLVVAGVIEVRT